MLFYACEISAFDYDYSTLNFPNIAHIVQVLEPILSPQDVVCAYEVDADGNTILTTTHYLTNGTQRVFKSCVLPTVYVGTAMTLQQAFELAPVNATIVLKADVKLAAPIELDKKITLKLNGFNVLNAENEPVEADTLIVETVAGNLNIIA